MNRFSTIAIPPFDENARAAAAQRQGQLTKPPGSLGRLETLACRIAGMKATPRPQLARKDVIIMAGDHGVAAEGVSAYPAEVTRQMVLNFLNGGAAVNVLAQQAGANVTVVDVGVRADLPSHPKLVARKVAPGTGNMAKQPAMTPAEAEAAIQVGLDLVQAKAKAGLDVVAVGEMGIGNTTAAAAIVATVAGRPVAGVTGMGTGIKPQQLAHKVHVIEQALQHHRPDPADPLDVLTKVGGLEIAGLVGVTLGAAAQRIPVVMDGLIASTAVLLAVLLNPRVKPYLIAGHGSTEPGHQVILDYLKLEPLLRLEMRLGEGSGAVLAFHLLEAAVRTLNDMATFAEAGVSDKTAQETP